MREIVNEELVARIARASASCSRPSVHSPWWLELPCIVAALLWEPVYYWRKVQFEKGLRNK